MYRLMINRYDLFTSLLADWNSYLWIGGLREAGVFCWAGLVTDLITNDDWEPTKPSTAATQNCMAIGDNGWNNGQCDWWFQFLCETDL